MQSFMVTLTNVWLSVTSSFCGTAWMFVWISARAVHICQEVLVSNDIGCLVAWIKWMSSSTRSMKFSFFERKLFFFLLKRDCKHNFFITHGAEVLCRRTPKRRKCRSELLENAILGKMLKIDEPGETIEEIPFSEEGLDEL